MTDKEQQQVVQLAKKFIREMHPKEIKENPSLRVYLIEGFIAGYCVAMRTAASWHSVDECLPERDAECIVLDKDGRISFGHIVDPDIAESHDGWNIPGIRFWMEWKPVEGMPV